MKSIFKRSAIGLVVLGMAGSAMAMSHAKAAPAAAPMPASSGMWSPHMNGWFVGVEGLYLQGRNGDTDFLTVQPESEHDAFHSINVSPDYNWNWRIFGGVKFTDNDDITLSWFRMRNDASEDFANSNGLYVAPRFFHSSDEWADLYSKVTFDLDDVYGVWGHTIHFNNPWTVRFAAGLEYAKLDSDFTVSGNYSTHGRQTYVSENEFKGFGPRVEFDMTYHLPYNVALFANTNAALLVGHRDISLNGFDDEDRGYFISNFDYSDRDVVVPKFGMRLGASYSMMFGQAGGEGPCSSLTLSAGWQVESYIHAIERAGAGYGGDVSTAAKSVQGGWYGDSSTKTSNFSDQGLFLGLSYSSDWM